MSYLDNGQDLLVSEVVCSASLIPVGGVQNASLHTYAIAASEPTSVDQKSGSD
jgi:hypothetical protein